MTGYAAAIFFATLLMLLLHVAEWRTASAGAAAAPNGKTVIAMSAVAGLDLAEMALLARLLWILVAPVIAVTGIAAFSAEHRI